MKQSVFFEEWRKCLQEHYKDVIRREDKLTERTLVPVLYKVGFTEDELRALYMEATLRADQLRDDFMPDMERFQEEHDLHHQTIAKSVSQSANAHVEELTFQAHPAECSCPSCMDAVDLLKHDPDGQPASPEQIAENQERATAPKQKTLF